MSTNQLEIQPIIPSTPRNFAPVKPLASLAEGNRKPESTLGRIVRERFEHYYNLEKRIRESMIAAGYQNAMFIEGKQFLTRDRSQPGGWIAYQPKKLGEREKRSLNFTRFYVSNSLWKWQLSNPDIVAIPGVETEQAREAAQAADIIVENHERQFYTPQLTLQEGLHGLCFGTYIWEVDYDDSLTTTTALQPIFGMKPVTLGEGWGQCGSCPYAGVASDFPQVQADILSPPVSVCPNCGGEALVDQPANEMLPTVTGQQEVKLGRLVARLKAFPECGWNYKYTAEESSWFYYQRRTSAAAILRVLGDVRLPGNGTGVDDFGLTIMDKLGWATGGGSGLAANSESRRQLYEDPATIVEFSLGPDDYAGERLKEDEPTLDGGVIPAGLLTDSFPNGFTVRGINGFIGDLIIHMRNRHHSVTHKSGIWHPRAGSGAGQGIDDLTEVQKRSNTNDSQILTFLRSSSTPAMRVLKGAIGEKDRGQYLGEPGINIWVDGNRLPEGVRFQDAVGPVFQPQGVPAQFFGYTYQQLNNFAQITSHITDFSGGLPGVGNRTATGAQITQANSNALFTTPLQVKGEVRKRLAEIVVQLYRIHFPVDRPFQFKGKHGRDQYIYLNGADLTTDIQFEVVKDSELPRNMFTKREDITAMFMMLGGAQGYQAMQEVNPELLIEMEKLFNVQLQSSSYDQNASLCQKRLTQLRQVATVAPDPTLLTGLLKDPITGQLLPVGEGVLDPPVALEEPDHDAKARWLSEWLDTDEGQTAGPVLRGAVILLINFHFQLAGVAGREMAFQAGSIQAAGAAPGAIGQAVGGAVNNEVNPVPDVNNDVPDVNKPGGPITGRPKNGGPGK